jgi:hypothetical protein
MRWLMHCFGYNFGEVIVVDVSLSTTKSAASREHTGNTYSTAIFSSVRIAVSAVYDGGATASTGVEELASGDTGDILGDA